MIKVLAKTTVAVILQNINVSVNMLYTLKLHNIICKLYLHNIKKKAGTVDLSSYPHRSDSNQSFALGYYDH